MRVRDVSGGRVRAAFGRAHHGRSTRNVPSPHVTETLLRVYGFLETLAVPPVPSDVGGNALRSSIRHFLEANPLPSLASSQGSKQPVRQDQHAGERPDGMHGVQHVELDGLLEETGQVDESGDAEEPGSTEIDELLMQMSLAEDGNARLRPSSVAEAG